MLGEMQVDTVSARPSYFDEFSVIRFERKDGILIMRLHTDGGPLDWGCGPTNYQLQAAFEAVAKDRDNGVIIFTGTGDVFSGPEIPIRRNDSGRPAQISTRPWGVIFAEVLRLQNNLINLPVPVIAAVNGPAVRHCELPMMCDIVIATEDTVFQDSAHFTGGLVPGDGKHIVYAMLMGENRGRYFMYTGQKLTAEQALAIGIIQEIHPRERLMARAMELASDMMLQSDSVRRYTRLLLTDPMRKALADRLPMGVALEGLACFEDGHAKPASQA
jgi:enoyl-CoA hydratase/carnithine racemase